MPSSVSQISNDFRAARGHGAVVTWRMRGVFGQLSMDATRAAHERWRNVIRMTRRASTRIICARCVRRSAKSYYVVSTLPASGIRRLISSCCNWQHRFLSRALTPWQWPELLSTHLYYPAYLSEQGRSHGWKVEGDQGWVPTPGRLRPGLGVGCGRGPLPLWGSGGITPGIFFGKLRC